MLKSKVGYSKHSRAIISGKESAKMAMEDHEHPKVGFLFGSCVYKADELLKGVHTITGSLPIIGCTSAGGIIVPDGIVSNKKGFSGLMILDDEDLKVTVAGSMKEVDPRKTGQKIALEAIQKSGTKVRPSYFYMVASLNDEELYLKGIEDVIGRVPCFGGTSADNALKGEWEIYCNDETYKDGCAVAFFYSNKKIETEFTGSYMETLDRGIITKVDKQKTLSKIDEIPALEKYAQWRGLHVEDIYGTKLLSASVTSPLGIKDPMGGLTLIRQPMVGNNDNTMNIGNQLQVGTAVIRMESDVEGLISSTKSVMVNVRNKLSNKPGAYILIHDSGRKLGIGNRLEEVYENIKEIAEDVPFIMAFTFGEYGYQNHSANSCGGLMLSFTAFAQDANNE